MAKVKIDDVKLDKLRSYFLDGGSDEAVDIMEQLGTEDEKVMGEYVNALKKRFPAEFDPDYVAPEPEVEDFKFFLDDGSGLLTELEQVRKKGAKIYFRKLEPKDIVTLIVRGVSVEVDLIQLAKKSPGAILHGVTVAQLIQLAELAK